MGSARPGRVTAGCLVVMSRTDGNAAAQTGAWRLTRPHALPSSKAGSGTGHGTPAAVCRRAALGQDLLRQAGGVQLGNRG